MFWLLIKCRCCLAQGATWQQAGQASPWYHMNTRYVEPEKNYSNLCDECRAEESEYWADMWADYYSIIRS